MKKLADIGQVPPHSDDAEQGVLAGLMHGDVAVDDISLTPDDFYIPAHAVLYQACLELHQLGRPVDLPAVMGHLRERGRLDAAGGAEGIERIWDQEALGVQGRYYAGIVHAKSRLRHLINMCASIMADAYRTPWDQAEHVIDSAEQRVFGIAEQACQMPDPTVSRDVADAAIDAFENKIIAPEKYQGIRLGWPSIDSIIRGVQPGREVLLSARPGCGKTAAALNMAMSMAATGLHVLFCSLEMTAGEIMARQIASASHVPLDRVLEPDGQLTDDDISRIYERSGHLDMPIWYDDTAALSVGALRAMARRQKARHGLDVVIIDYLQLMTVDQQHKNEEERIACISRSIKSLAKELNIVVIALAQLNRALEYRDDSTPRASDLRGSGSLEQDADIIIMMHRQFQTVGQGSTLSDIPVIFDIVKNRQGNKGAAVLLYRGQYTTFEDYDPYYKFNAPF